MKKPILAAASLLLLGGTAFADCPPGNSEVVVSITTDRYGDETTWSLTGPGGTPSYAAGGPYSLGPTNGAYPQTPVTVCIPHGSVVVFTIRDEYGDGLCCNYGQGTYNVKVDGTTVVAYASFQNARTVTFQVGPQMPNDVAMYAVNLPAMIGSGNTNITGTMRNFGASTISSFLLNYSVDNGAVETATINANVSAGGQYNFTHPTPWAAAPGTHSVKVWVGLPGGPDGYPSNDTITTSVSVATQQVTRTTLLEEFTSSTCPPCYQLNVVNGFDQMLSNMQTNQPGSHLAAIKYQMNWPAPGNDPSYNSDGNTRKNYYGVGGVPDPYIEGTSVWPPSSTLINNAMNKPSFVSMDVAYTLNGTTVDVTVNVTPHYSGVGYKTYIAITEDFYNYPGAYTPQKDYHFAMRKMLPNGNGITMSPLVADQTQTFTQSYTLNEGGPAQGNYNLWGTVNGITIVAFVQHVATKEVVQAAFAASPTVGINEQVRANDLLQAWPNPTDGKLYLRYDQPLGKDATVEVFNALGERVLNEQRRFAASGQLETIDLQGQQPGMYLVRVVAEGRTSTRRINLIR